jgi:TolA-binding protein
MIKKLFPLLVLSFFLFPALSHAGEKSTATPAPAAPLTPATTTQSPQPPQPPLPALPPLPPLPALTPAPHAMGEKARFDHALGLYMQGRLDAASEEFLVYLKDFREGEHADDSLYWLGKCRELAGRFGEASVLLRRAISDFPASDIAASIQFELGYCLYSPKNPGRDLTLAFAEFMKVPSLYQGDPVIPQALYYAAKCQSGLGEFTKARDIFTRITADFPDSPYAAPALYNIGRIYLTEGNADEAMGAFKSLLGRYPAGLYSNQAASALSMAGSDKEKKGLAEGSPSGTPVK